MKDPASQSGDSLNCYAMNMSSPATLHRHFDYHSNDVTLETLNCEEARRDTVCDKTRRGATTF
jgi:hypothetical protein